MSGWAPARGVPSHEPILLLEAGWHEIVGDQVARNSRPTRITDATLTVTTRSSAWSHQLSFLSEHILRAVAARVPSAGVARLRFRIGRISQRPPSRNRRSGQRPIRAREAWKRKPSGSADEALARFRGDVEAQGRERRAEGWRECERCGALVAPGAAPRCAACIASGDQTLEFATARLLYEAPWLGFPGTAALVDGLQEEEYERIRGRMLAHWRRLLARARATKRLARDGRERLVASSYVLLQSRLPPEAILPATVRNILGDELHDLLYAETVESRSVRHQS